MLAGFPTSGAGLADAWGTGGRVRSPGGLTCSPGGLGDLSIRPWRTVPRPGLAEGAAATGPPESLGVVARDEDCVQVSLLLAWLPLILFKTLVTQECKSQQLCGLG